MDWDKAKWNEFLDSIANIYQLTESQKQAFIARFKRDNLETNETDVVPDYSSINTFKKQLGEVYKKFSKDRADLNGPTRENLRF